jgi:hypothetical protein
LNSSQKGTSYSKARGTGFLKLSMAKSGMLGWGSGLSDDQPLLIGNPVAFHLLFCD